MYLKLAFVFSILVNYPGLYLRKTEPSDMHLLLCFVMLGDGRR